MSDETTTSVDETVVPATEETCEKTCTNGVCDDGTTCTEGECPITEEAPAEVEATTAE